MADVMIADAVKLLGMDRHFVIDCDARYSKAPPPIVLLAKMFMLKWSAPSGPIREFTAFLITLMEERSRKFSALTSTKASLSFRICLAHNTKQPISLGKHKFLVIAKFLFMALSPRTVALVRTCQEIR